MFRWFTNRRRTALRRTPLPDAWQAIIQPERALRGAAVRCRPRRAGRPRAGVPGREALRRVRRPRAHRRDPRHHRRAGVRPAAAPRDGLLLAAGVDSRVPVHVRRARWAPRGRWPHQRRRAGATRRIVDVGGGGARVGQRAGRHARHARRAQRGAARVRAPARPGGRRVRRRAHPVAPFALRRVGARAGSGVRRARGGHAEIATAT